MSITENITRLKASLPAGVTLVAVSKFHPVEALQEAYNAGQRVFGESRAQELTAKQKVLPSDIEWHFIGPLQSNKVKDITPFIHTIHSIDSLKLLQEVNKQAAKHDRISNRTRMIVSSVSCWRYISRKKKPSTASVLTNAVNCYTVCCPKPFPTSGYAD